MKKIFISLILITPFIALAYSYGDLGFWSGIWHGVTFPFRLFFKLFWTDITIYEQFNSTYMYHVGFLIGLLGIMSGSRAR
jgi:hypothetical protein